MPIIRPSIIRPSVNLPSLGESHSAGSDGIEMIEINPVCSCDHGAGDPIPRWQQTQSPTTQVNLDREADASTTMVSSLSCQLPAIELDQQTSQPQPTPLEEPQTLSDQHRHTLPRHSKVKTPRVRTSIGDERPPGGKNVAQRPSRGTGTGDVGHGTWTYVCRA